MSDALSNQFQSSPELSEELFDCTNFFVKESSPKLPVPQILTDSSWDIIEQVPDDVPKSKEKQIRKAKVSKTGKPGKIEQQH